ncbi:MAG: glycosyltransferase, partial [Acidobacteriota bacterium]|nr:glycosyltransferase [Acidobacteriota bacterium]
RISVIVVSHNRIALLRKCLDRLGAPGQVIVADNGSTDGSAQLEADYPNVRFIRIPRNFGLTKALNLGLRSSDGELVLFLHEDVEISPGVVQALAAVLDTRPEIGAVSPLLLDDAGSPVPQVCALPTPDQPESLWTPASPDEDREVECATGAAIMFRSFFLKALREIDAHYGNYGSDIELCAQIRRSGKKVLVLHEIHAVHHGTEDQSSGGLRAQSAADRELGMAVYLSKHFGFWPGLKHRIGRSFGALLSFRLTELKLLVAGQKIDGTHR